MINHGSAKFVDKRGLSTVNLVYQPINLVYRAYWQIVVDKHGLSKFWLITGKKTWFIDAKCRKKSINLPYQSLISLSVDKLSLSTDKLSLSVDKLGLSTDKLGLSDTILAVSVNKPGLSELLGTWLVIGLSLGRSTQI